MSVTNLSRYISTEGHAEVLSSREASFRSFGNDGSGRGRLSKIKERAADRRADAMAKRHREAKLKPNEVVAFGIETFLRISEIAARRMRAGDADAFRADRILSRTVRCKSSGEVAIAPGAESAAFLAGWLRSRGVDVFCSALSELDRIAGVPAPTGRPVDLAIPDLLTALDVLEFSGVADAESAAADLRAACTHGCHARLHVTPERAGFIADVAAHLRVSRHLVSTLDAIAGRTEPRPH